MRIYDEPYRTEILNACKRMGTPMVTIDQITNRTTANEDEVIENAVSGEVRTCGTDDMDLFSIVDVMKIPGVTDKVLHATIEQAKEESHYIKAGEESEEYRKAIEELNLAYYLRDQPEHPFWKTYDPKKPKPKK